MLLMFLRGRNLIAQQQTMILLNKLPVKYHTHRLFLNALSVMDHPTQCFLPWGTTMYRMHIQIPLVWEERLTLLQPVSGYQQESTYRGGHGQSVVGQPSTFYPGIDSAYLGNANVGKEFNMLGGLSKFFADPGGSDFSLNQPVSRQASYASYNWNNIPEPTANPAIAGSSHAPLGQFSQQSHVLTQEEGGAESNRECWYAGL
nr:uncharacterized protein CI109_007281 [Kwoniella shandongensis]KAA5524405.1 hypothetical protein CI109_007281 [Kwoniella shandongensis]